MGQGRETTSIRDAEMYGWHVGTKRGKRTIEGCSSREASIGEREVTSRMSL